MFITSKYRIKVSCADLAQRSRFANPTSKRSDIKINFTFDHTSADFILINLKVLSTRRTEGQANQQINQPHNQPTCYYSSTSSSPWILNPVISRHPLFCQSALMHFSTRQGKYRRIHNPCLDRIKEFNRAGQACTSEKIPTISLHYRQRLNVRDVTLQWEYSEWEREKCIMLYFQSET